MSPRVSIVIPAYEEAQNIESVLRRIHEGVTLPCEVLVVCDTPDDSTIPVVQRFAEDHPYVAALIQPYGRGPANAMRYGFEQAAADATVVTMADGSDDVRLIDDMVYLIERGCVVVAASRYMPGGAQVGGPRLKRVMSQTAGLSLSLFAGVTTRDATNSFKAYSTQFVHAVGIESTDGFEVGIELVAKARRLRAPIAELPTIWLDRSGGESNFQMWNWIPSYLKWYRFAFGRPLPSADALRQLTPRNR